MSCVSGRLQSLESLHIKFIGPLHGELDCFHLAPKLTSLVFSANSRMTSDVWAPTLLKMPYKQIRHYHWQDMEDRDITLPIRKRIFMVSKRALCLLQDLESCRLLLHSRTVSQYHSRLTSAKFTQGRLSATFKRLRELELDSLDEGSGIHVVLLYLKVPLFGNFASTYTADALTDALEARWRATTEPDASDSVATPSPRLLAVRLDKEVDDERLDQLRVEGRQVGVWGETDE
ncbi:hypothetical protein AAF712_010739 [Marasmius tenuissimus]|uniref:Uncharacterized protein n=1 Tax=Marasmius tenuissimus TaxID=585030 RepID=A0ABR2ZLX5_9AGAR